MDPASWAVTLGLSTEKLSVVCENALLLVVKVGMHVGLCVCFMTLLIPCGVSKQDVTRKGDCLKLLPNLRTVLLTALQW